MTTATTKKPSLKARIAWSRAKRLSALKEITVAEARKILKGDPAALAKLEYTPEVLAEKEAELREKHSHIVKGSLKFNIDGPHTNKMTVVIKCTHAGCQETREIATSDLHQVTMCPEHTREARNARRRQNYTAKVKAKK